MNTYNTKTYIAHGGDELVVGGKLTILEGAQVTGLPQAANQVASTASTVAALKDDLNALLTALKTAGLMEPDPEPSSGDDE